MRLDRLLGMKLEDLTRADLSEAKIFPIDTEKYTEEMLDDCYESFEIGNLEYGAGRTLKAIDPVAFCQCVNDYQDSMITDGQWVEVDGLTYDKSEVYDLLCLPLDE